MNKKYSKDLVDGWLEGDIRIILAFNFLIVFEESKFALFIKNKLNLMIVEFRWGADYWLCL
jgi:hypothetical protein